jgi:hypothetical protein
LRENPSVPVFDLYPKGKERRKLLKLVYSDKRAIEQGEEDLG